ncbi:unnamed protein product [Prorocentrum cordatum]|uniref:Uncharacterized protein n=1 Tax=Prorocentrum cordatum TaxID=2364126 RepID=A0ABN9T1J1_9DINO|nr:unnamed protein product [Polarella glacialis]
MTTIVRRRPGLRDDPPRQGVSRVVGGAKPSPTDVGFPDQLYPNNPTMRRWPEAARRALDAARASRGGPQGGIGLQAGGAAGAARGGAADAAGSASGPAQRCAGAEGLRQSTGAPREADAAPGPARSEQERAAEPEPAGDRAGRRHAELLANAQRTEDLRQQRGAVLQGGAECDRLLDTAWQAAIKVEAAAADTVRAFSPLGGALCAGLTSSAAAGPTLRAELELGKGLKLMETAEELTAFAADPEFRAVVPMPSRDSLEKLAGRMEYLRALLHQLHEGLRVCRVSTTTMVCAEVLRAHRDPQSRTSLPAQLKRDDFVEFLSGLGQQCIDDDRMPRELHTFVSRMYLELLFEQLALGDEVLETDYALTLLGQHRKFRVLPRNHCWPDGRADGARAVITEQRLLGPSRIKAKIHVEEGDTLTALSLPQKLSDGTVRMHCDAKGVVGWVTVRTNMGTKLVAPFSQINMRTARRGPVGDLKGCGYA